MSGSMRTSSTESDELSPEIASPPKAARNDSEVFQTLEKASAASPAGEEAAASRPMSAAKRAPRAGSGRCFRPWNGVASERLAETLLQLAPAASAQLESGPVLEEHHLLPLEVRLDFANPVEVDDRRAVDPEE